MLMPGTDLRRDRREPRLQIFDIAIAEVLLEPVAEALTTDQPRSGEIEIEITEDALRRQFASPHFEIVEMTGRIAAADDRAD